MIQKVRVETSPGGVLDSERVNTFASLRSLGSENEDSHQISPFSLSRRKSCIG